MMDVPLYESYLLNMQISGVQVYRKFYSEEKERSNGVLAICVEKPVSQPSICLGSMLSVSMLSALLILKLEVQYLDHGKMTYCYHSSCAPKS